MAEILKARPEGVDAGVWRRFRERLDYCPADVTKGAGLKGVAKAACFPVLALAKHLGLPAPGLDQDEAISRADAIAILNEVFGHMFPGLHEA